MTKDTVGGNRFFDIAYLIKNTVLCYALTAALLFAASVAAAMTALPEASVGLIVSIITYICICLCGFRAAKHSGSGGLLSGALSGLIYIALLYFIGSLVFGELNFTYSTALTVLICIVCGAIGGIMGVNSHRKKRR